MGETFRALSEADIKIIAHDINMRGFGAALNFVPNEALAEMRAMVERGVAANGGEYIAFTGSEAVAGTMLETLACSDAFRRACRDIYRAGTGHAAPDVPFFQVLRCLSGQSGARHSWYFHYDSYVLTALVPIIIPQEGRRGDLYMFPNMRPIRRFYLTNLFDKIMLDNALTQTLIRKAIDWGWMKPVRVAMVPGNVYFFWGCRSIHANEPCDIDKIRSTALIHFIDPHQHSWLRGRLGRSQRVITSKRLMELAGKVS